MHSCCSDTLFLLMLVFFLSPCRLLYSNSPSPHSFSLPLSSLSSVSLWLDFPHCLPSLCPLTLNFLTASFTLSTNTEFSSLPPFTLSTNTEFPHCFPSLCPLTLNFPHCLPSLCPLTLNFLTASFTLSTNTEFSSLPPFTLSTNTEFPHCFPSLCPLTLNFLTASLHFVH